LIRTARELALGDADSSGLAEMRSEGDVGVSKVRRVAKIEQIK
jgi:hypothetical protein